MDSQLLDRLNVSATYFHATGTNDYNDPTYDGPININCYKKEEIKLVKTLQGTERHSTVQLYCDGLLELGGSDYFKVEGLEGDYPLLGYSRYPGLKPGTGTTVVYL